MKKLLLIMTALGSIGLGLRAQDVAPASTYVVTADFSYGTKYVFRGVQQAKGTLFPSIEVATGPITAGIWAALPVVDGVDDEIDFYAGYGAVLAENWTLDAGACLYYYPEHYTGASTGRSAFEPYIGLRGSAQGFSPGVYVYYDIDHEVLTLEGSIGYSVALEPAGTSLDFSASLGRADPKSGSSMTYYNLGLAVPFAISSTSKITVGVNYAHNNLPGGDAFGKTNHLYGTIGLTVRF